MIKRLLILLLVLQALCIGLLATGLYYWWRPAWQAELSAPATAAFYLACGLGAVLLVRLFISANNFFMSSRAGSVTPPDHALNLFSAASLFWHEFNSSMLTSSYYMLRPIGMRLHPAAQGLPVLLIHGYACNSGYWLPMSKLLAQARISHYGIDLEPPGASIDDFAPQVQAAVERLRRETGSAQVIIVGHSMGGLVVRAYLRRYGNAQVARVVTLGTPHHGTALANLGPGSNAAQMRRHSEWLGTLAASEANTQRMLFSSIYSVHDNIIAPQDSSDLPGARNLVFGAIGHVALGRHPAILRCALQEIVTVGQRAHV
ncbi:MULTISPECIES: triacylglycerol lipase [unclassified Duganella]|uniref:esterase/lipase family protein n=1 Tax=unclassified Duganella TaxID=2636909 RepID=UPI00088493B5|nr:MULTISPECIES: alpha/beta fold hydrolase [unclassified Duganella]SDH54539.1 alpha/beta hydrolase fold [Duganella sp. OV458]SDK68470.1 alpha/beta hydrolase fold [Duganella sp. OV510]